MVLISVVIPSFNGESKLPLVLDSLIQQINQNFEVIVVLDGSTDQSLTVCESFKSQIPNLTIKLQQNGGRARARNVGASLVRSDRILFLDDDIILPNDCIDHHIELSSKHPNKVFIGNAYLKNTVLDDPFSKYRMRMEKKWETNQLIEQITLLNYKFSSANLSISKQLFHQVGEFDERLKDSEDFELGIRLLQNNSMIEMHKSLEVGHFDLKAINQYITRQINYIDSKKNLLKIYPEYRQLIPNHFEFELVNPIKKILASYLYFPQLVQLWWNFSMKGSLKPPHDFITSFHIWQQTHISNKS